MATNQSPINSRWTIHTVEGFLDVTRGTGFFDVCSGPRPGGHFLQKEAWEARVIARDSTARAIRRVVGEARDG